MNLINDAVVTYIKRKHTPKNMTPVDASNHPEKVRCSFSFTVIKPRLNLGDYVRKTDKRNIFFEGYKSNWNRELFNVNHALKSQPPTQLTFVISLPLMLSLNIIN